MKYDLATLLRCVFTIAILLHCAVADAQVCKVKDGRMYIEIDKRLEPDALDNFIAAYELNDLPIKDALRGKHLDSLQRMGWKIEQNTATIFAISKKLSSAGKDVDPGERIRITERKPSLAERFPVTSRAVVYGYNRFRNKNPFAVNGDVVTFFLRGNTNARRVMLAGSFNEWNPDALAMTPTDSGWIAQVKLLPGKYWYKFIVDGGWRTDADNFHSENDGEGNINSVYYKANWLFRVKGMQNASRVYVAGSFNNWREREMQLQRSGEGWALPVYLQDGTHTYRFIADKNWFTDPDNPDKFPNEFNDYNSVVRVGSPYMFQLRAFENARKVTLAGSFNQWRNYELQMRKVTGGWELPYTLGPGNYAFHYIVDGKTMPDPNDAAIKDIKGHSGNSFFIIGGNYTFRLKGHANARSVFLSGDFNDWSPNTFSMRKENNDWVLRVHLSPGKHLYKFVVDGKWIIDPSNKLWEQNEFGNGNSVLWFENQ